MGKIVYVEMLDRRGHVRQRYRLDTFPATIGRAYSNSVILDDRHACPEHVRVSLDEEGGIVLEDLRSVNGICLSPSQKRVPGHTVPPGKDAEIKVGNTLLRFRGDDFVVGPAEMRSISEGTFQKLFERQWTAFLIFLLGFGIFIFNFLLESHERMPGQDLIGKSMVFIMLLLIWAGFWSFVNRLTAHAFNYASHLGLAASASTVMLLYDTLNEYYEFLFSATTSSSIIGIIGAVAFLTMLLYGHLSLMNASSPGRRLASSALVVLGLTGVMALVGYMIESEFSNQLKYSSEMKPVGQQWMRTETPENFFSDLDSLRKDVDKMAEKAAAKARPR